MGEEGNEEGVKALGRAGFRPVWAEQEGLGRSWTLRSSTPRERDLLPQCWEEAAILDETPWRDVSSFIWCHFLFLYLHIMHTLSTSCTTLLQIWTPTLRDRQWAGAPGPPSENVSKVIWGVQHGPYNLRSPVVSGGRGTTFCSWEWDLLL